MYVQINENLTLGKIDQEQHGVNGCPLQWTIKHIFDHFGIPLDSAATSHASQHILISSSISLNDIKKVDCDCTPRPHMLMEMHGLLAGFGEGDVVMHLPTVKSLENWMLCISRQGYVGYFYQDWLGDLTKDDISAIESHPLDRFRSKSIQD